MVLRRNDVREQAAVKVVHFVLQAARQKAVALDGNGLSVHQGERGFYAGTPHDVRIYFGNAEASFPVRYFFAEEMQDRVDEVQRHKLRQRGGAAVHFQPRGGSVREGDVDGDHLDGAAHLRRRQSYACLRQRLLHVFQEVKNIGIDMDDGTAFLPQGGMPVLQNVKNHGRYGVEQVIRCDCPEGGSVHFFYNGWGVEIQRNNSDSKICLSKFFADGMKRP